MQIKLKNIDSKMENVSGKRNKSLAFIAYYNYFTFLTDLCLSVCMYVCICICII